MKEDPASVSKDDYSNYIVCAAKNLKKDEEWTYIYYPYGVESYYSYLYRFDMSNPDNVYEYAAYIAMDGTTYAGEDDTKGSNFSDWVYLSFYFNEPKAATPGDGNKVEGIESAENAPAVFYNISGQRVENPSNGIFIRKQGNKVNKIVIR